MLDRYENECYELEMELRAGAQFIKLSQIIFDQFSALRFPNQKEKMQALRSAIVELNKIWQESQKGRLLFSVPEKLKSDYLQAKRYYAYLKANPSEFYQKETTKYEELLQEQKLLEDKIEQKELEVSRAEDDVRHFVRDKRARINAEHAHLKAKQAKYEALKNQRQQSCMPICFRGNRKIDKLPGTLAKIARLEVELKRLSGYVSRDLEEKRDYLRLLRDKRWEIGNKLHVPQDSQQLRREQWNDAVSRAEVTMMFRRLDIEKAIKRYYAAEKKQIIHAMLIVYSLIYEIAVNISNKPDKLTHDLSALNQLSEQLYCPDVGNLSVLALFRVIAEFKEVHRNQIITCKPKPDFLPELLMRALSSSYIADSLDSAGLYRKALISAEAKNSVNAEVLQSALKK